FFRMFQVLPDVPKGSRRVGRSRIEARSPNGAIAGAPSSVIPHISPSGKCGSENRHYPDSGFRFAKIRNNDRERGQSIYEGAALSQGVLPDVREAASGSGIEP